MIICAKPNVSICGIGEPVSIGKALNNPERITVAKAIITKPIMTGMIKPQINVFRLNFPGSVNLVTPFFYYVWAY